MWEFIKSRAVTCGFSHTSEDKEGKRRGWNVNPSVFLLSDKAALEHMGKVLAKRAKGICLTQRVRLLMQTLNSFFLPLFGYGGGFPPRYLAEFPLFLSSKRHWAVYGRQDCRETHYVISVPFSSCPSARPHSTSGCLSLCE